MVPRGAVGIIVAGRGQAAGVIEGRLFAVVIGMSIATTLLAPPLLRRELQREQDQSARLLDSEREEEEDRLGG